MAWTQSDVDALKAAIAAGVRRVAINDRMVEYQDMAAMIRALSLMEAEVASSASKVSPSRTVLVKHGRGV